MTSEPPEDRPPAPARRAIGRRRQPRSRAVIRRPSEGRADQIRSAAATLFRERGYVRTSLADIAAAVGILPGSLYHYIDSKEDLLFDIIETAHRDLIERVEAQPLETLPPAEALRLVVRIHVEEIARNLTFSIVSNIDLRELGDERRTSLLARRAEYQKVLSSLVRRGQDEGAWCARIDTVVASLSIAATSNSLTFWYRPDDPRWTVDGIAEQYAAMAVHSLACDHDPPCAAAVTG